MITLKEAVAHARDYFQSIYPDAEKGLVEEVEMDEDEQFWLITLSFRPNTEGSPSMSTTIESSLLAEILSPKTNRLYKSFKINAETGKVMSMKIRVLAI